MPPICYHQPIQVDNLALLWHCCADASQVLVAVRTSIFPPCGPEPKVLEIGTCDAGHERGAVQAGPGPPLEVVQSVVLLELLMCLLADPASLDGCRQSPQRRARREIAEIVYLRSPLRRHSPISQTSSPGRWP
jgi:hypothetical protein